MKPTVSRERDKKEKIFILICVLALIFSAVLGICAGTVSIPLPKLLEAIGGGADTLNGRIILYARLPRVAASLLAGAALAVAGAVIQSVLENPLAAPSVIGVNAGAGFLTVLAMALFPGRLSLYPAAAFVGAVASVMGVYAIAAKNGASKMSLVLAGVAVSSLLNAGINTVTTVYPDALGGINSFKIGGVTGVSLSRLHPAWIYIAVGIAVVMLLSHETDILSLGDRTARGLGMNVRAVRLILLFSAAMLSGAAVSFAGLLSFIGLIIPHMARHFIKSGSVRLIPACALMGAAFTAFCDTLSRVIFPPYEIQLGIVVSFIGAPFFIYLIMKRKGGRHGDRN